MFLDAVLGSGNAKVTVAPMYNNIVGKRPRENETTVEGPPLKKIQKENTDISKAASTSGKPVYVPYVQKYVLMSMCRPCMQETRNRIKVTPTGRQFTTFSLCTKCVQKNRTLTDLLKK